MSKSLKLLLPALFLVLCMPLVGASLIEIGKYLGLRKVSVPVVGTGSMYPSLYWEVAEGGPDDAQKEVIAEYRTTPRMYRRFPGVTLFDRTLLRRELGIGDMVTFRNDETIRILESEGKDTSSGFIKRIVALPGDTVKLLDGYLYQRGEPVAEPYIYRPRSTYGDQTLEDCQTLTIPEGSYFVMGDNRKTSSDSRGELGLIRDEDIGFVLPYDEQELYYPLWRDPSKDQELIGTPTLNAEEFYLLVNKVRLSAGLTPLNVKSTLTKSASYKAQEILADNPDYPLASALAKAGYKNIITGEFSVRGRFTAEELLTNILYFDSTKNQLLDSRYSDIGISDLNEEVDSCPTEVVVAHLGGYIPAEYEEETLSGWRELRANLTRILPSWEKAQDYDNLDQVRLQELLTIFRRRLALAGEVIETMENREWLTDDQQARIQADEADSVRSKALSEELNQ